MRFIFICITLLILMCAGAASAHAYLDHAEPKVGSSVDSSPKEIKIWFSEAVEPAFSAIKVLDANGKQIEKQDTHQDEKDKSLLIVTVPDLPAGTYKVEWSVTARDTHHTHGDFKFTVKAKS